MKQILKRAACLVAGLGLFAAIVPACSAQTGVPSGTLLIPALTFQRRPPDWAIGRFKGHNKKVDVDIDMTITSGGSITGRTSDRRGNSNSFNGSFARGRININGNEYTIEEIWRGIRLIQVNDRTNTVNMSKIGGPGGFDPGDSGDQSGGGNDDDRQRPPSWAVGRFTGYNEKYDNDMDMTIASDGRITVTTRNNGRSSTKRGNWRNGRLEIDNRRYTVTSIDDGIRTVETGDRNNRVDYRRGSGGGSGGGSGDSQRPPDWAIGVFEGRNDQNDNDMQLTIRRSGEVVSRITRPSGRVTTERGSYRNGRIELDGETYSLTRTRNGVATTEIGDRSNRISYRKVD